MDYNSFFSEYEYFDINVEEYDSSKHFSVTRPASMNNPKDHSVMFIQKKYLANAPNFERANKQF